MPKSKSSTLQVKSLLPIANVHSNSPGFPKPTVNQDRPVGPIKLRDLNCISALVTPVQVSTNPVNSQTIWVIQGGSV